MAKSVTVIPASRTAPAEKSYKTTLRVAAYCRVSTEQEEQQGSFENQVEYYTELINRNPGYVMAGIYADEGISGTRTQKRTGFQSMIRSCEDGRVDLVITKSISRFARNTADCLYYARRLKEIGIPIIFEKEGINTMESTGELLFTILSSLAQEESRNISENVQWGIRSKFRQGIPTINTGRFLGYDKDETGKLIINNEQAKIVRRIFREYMEGWSTAEIASRLNHERICGVSGKIAWNGMTILHMLQNEKHAGDLLMQKTYTVDFLKHKRIRNDGTIDQYYVMDAHEAIIPREEWNAVQMEINRKRTFRDTHGTHDTTSVSGSPFFNKTFCADCGSVLERKVSRGRCRPFWKCRSCDTRVTEIDLREQMKDAWNHIVKKREEYLRRWTDTLQSGNALEKVRARQMLMLTRQPMLVREVPELTRMVLQEIRIGIPGSYEIFFLDGTIVCC